MSAIPNPDRQPHMHPYFDLKRELYPAMEKPLPIRSPGKRMVGFYYSQMPDVIIDTLSFFMFRKYADEHYPILYFHPVSRGINKDFVKQFDVTPCPLPDICFASKLAYSFFITSKEFYQFLARSYPEAEFYLIFQSDSFLVQTGLKEFMDQPYDYYGAVWEKGNLPEGWCQPRRPDMEVSDPKLAAQMKSVSVGNGGFSLRRISACRKVCEEYRLNQLSYMQEDVFYCDFGQLTGLRLAPEGLARKFAWEDAPAVKVYINEMGIKLPLGFHNLPLPMAELLLKDALKRS